MRRGAKNDAADAAAICEAVTRPNMRFVSVKSVDSQGFLMLHRARGDPPETMTACAIRAHFAEFGIIVEQGRQRVDALVNWLDEEGLALPANARMAWGPCEPTEGLDQKVDAIERELAQIYRESPVAKLLSSIPGIGPTTSTARAATVPDPTIFCSGREFAPRLGPPPKQNSTGGKARPRAIPTSGTCSSSTVRGGWIEALLERGRPMVVAIAVSNKLARIVWR